MSPIRISLAVAATAAAATLVVTGPPASAEGDTCFEQPATIVGAGTITGTSGDDVILGSDGPDTIDGGGGHDLICALAGNDSVTDGPGPDLVDAGDGSDQLRQGVTSDPGDELDGGAGVDKAWYGDRTSDLSFTLGSSVLPDGAPNEFDSLSGIEQLVTGSGDDDVQGSEHDEYFSTGAGDDDVDGRAGHDTINVGSGANTADGGTGDDYLESGDGIDTLVGGDGDDSIISRGAVDTVDAGTGDDTVTDGLGADKVALGPGDDSITMYPTKDPHDVFDGGDGIDTAIYTPRTAAVKVNLTTTTADDGETAEYDKLLAVENVFGGAGNDTLTGTDGPNVLKGWGGNDTFTDGLGADVIDGYVGNDVLVQSATDGAGDDYDYFDGGQGTDEVSYAARTTGTAILIGDPEVVIGPVFWEDDLHGAEIARGGKGNDLIAGGSEVNELYGGSGNDTILDGAGADLVNGGAGCDTFIATAAADPGDVLVGSSGACDLVSYLWRVEPVTVNLGSTAAVQGAAGEGDVLKSTERAHGGSGDDLLTGNGSINVLTGWLGADTLKGMGGGDFLHLSDGVSGNDTADGGAGRDTAEIDNGDVVTTMEVVNVV